MIRLFPLLAVMVIMYSCSKKNDVVMPPVPPPVAVFPDTLTAGWSKINSLPQENFTDIFFTDNNNGYATGQSGIYKSVNAGIFWNKISNDYNINIAAAGNNRACFVNNLNTVFNTQNGGSTFQSIVYNAPGGTVTFEDCFYSDMNTCYLVSGKYIWKSTNGGILFDTVFNFQSSVPIASLFFLNNNIGAVMRSEGIYTTGDGGFSWSIGLNLSNATGALEFTDAATGFCAVVQNNSGISEIYKTLNGGNTWQSMFQTGSQNGAYSIPDIDFVSATVGYFSHTNRIFKTTNGGATWSQVIGLGNRSVTEIHFTDANHGWASTTDGTILRFLQ